jgi:hypothetical protein
MNLRFLNFVEIPALIGRQLTNNQVCKTCQEFFLTKQERCIKFNLSRLVGDQIELPKKGSSFFCAHL